MKSSLVFILFFSISLSILTAQEMEKSPMRIGLKGGVGYMITHSPIMEYVSEQNIYKTELYFEKQLIGTKSWHQRYAFPFAGFSISRFDFAKDEFFGSAYGIAPYYSFLLKGNEKLGLNLRTSVGFGWIENAFDIENNHKNVAIGSNLNLYFSVLMQAHWMPLKSWGISLGANFSHFSNTSFSKPNLGINLPSAEIGIFYQIGSSPKLSVQEEEKATSKDQIQIRWANGINENFPVNGPKFIASASSIEWERTINHKSSLGAGMDLYYNPAQKAKLAQDSVFINGGFENLQIGISLHHLLKFGQFGLGLKAGYYLQKKDPELKSYYTEVYGQQYVIKNLTAFVSLKTHLARAEYLLVGVKYNLSRN